MRPPPEGSLYLEDLSVGQVFVSAPWPALDEAAIKAFAGVYDPQPFHLDEAAAKDSLFGGLAASGWHTAAISMRLLLDAVPLVGGLIGKGGEIGWPRATRPGDVLTLYSEVVEITPSRSRPDRGMVTMRSETRNQHGEPVQVSRISMVAWRRPAGGES